MPADENKVQFVLAQTTDLRELLTDAASSCVDPGAALMLRTVREEIARLETLHLTAYLNRPDPVIPRR